MDFVEIIDDFTELRSKSLFLLRHTQTYLETNSELFDSELANGLRFYNQQLELDFLRLEKS